jgi:hypothetical protein
MSADMLLADMSGDMLADMSVICLPLMRIELTTLGLSVPCSNQLMSADMSAI